MNHLALSKLLRTVHRNVRCPQCGKKYSFSDIKIQGIIDSVCFLEMSCGEHLPLIATVILPDDVPTFEEDFDQVMADDVIDIYHSLTSYQGNFEELFNSE